MATGTVEDLPAATLDGLAADELARLRRSVALAQIVDLERQQARAMREHAIGRGGSPAELKTRLEDIDDQIVALRATLT